MLCQFGTEAWRAAEEAGLRVVAEGFVDRGYTADGLLVPRTEPGAMVVDAEAAAVRAVAMVTDGEIEAVDGTRVSIQADALVVHSDSAGAVEIARATRLALESAGIDMVRVR